MTSVHEKSATVRLLHAIRQNAFKKPGSLQHFVKSWMRYPINYAAEQAIKATPTVSFADLFPEFAEPSGLPHPGRMERHNWNARLDEKIYIGLMIEAIGAKKIFEIGTFDGGTTVHMARAAGEGAKIYTLDLPPQEFERTQAPGAFDSTMVGNKYKGTPEEARVTQIYGNSLEFDFSPYFGSMDFVFVDAAHDYIHGYPDSLNALKLVRPGGLVVWHDFIPKWSELVHAIREATTGLPLVTLASTSLAILKTESK